ncbi:ATP-grasp domain-containing protein [Chondromyces apiculatus]|uniref:Prokaryotic glutathione synthetase ATP-binding domain-containing protein n=1 Tax=Chondromyces apiculatus DSM 436 TaxID=1192034 RepID=A0A017TDY4_9BACT|nr:hypothetical protein [Chondromyces apiculatus]EYF07107.1 Hypothetical protein CAP_0586 [Chondromyces apiculatus DSM 436]
MNRSIAFLTSDQDPELTPDDQLAVQELDQLGIRVTPLVWDAPEVDLAHLQQFDLLVLRSCWDYHHKTAGFCAWLDAVERAGLPLHNPVPVVRWCLDKSYLDALASRGIAIPTTLWIEPGTDTTLNDLLHRGAFRDDAVVVKPAISMLGQDTWRASRADLAEHEAPFQDLLRTRKLMVQEFLPEVLDHGELSLIFIANRFSHAVRKLPKPGEFRIHAEHGGTRDLFVPSPALVTQAEAVLEAARALTGDPAHRLLYARVDGIDVGGRLTLIELELIDPYLFLRYAPGAPYRFAQAIEDILAGF